MASISKFIVLCFLLFGSTQAFAQKAGEILVVSQDWIAASLTTAVKPHYGGVLAVTTQLPQDLSRYDAIMMLKPWTNYDEIWLDSIQQDRLIQYVKNGGAFYAEGADFRNWGGGDDDTKDNQFWDFIGDSSEMHTAMVIDLTRIRGIDSEFTRGIDVSDEPYENMGDAGGGFHIENMRPLIWGDAGYSLPLAWAPLDRNIKAVLHWPIGGGHYDEFLARVVCTFFELCILDVSIQVDEVLTISYDPINSELHFPAPGEIVITDILGRAVLSSQVESVYSLPNDLLSGSYIVRWQSATQHASTAISAQ
jgi:hypothetical protein